MSVNQDAEVALRAQQRFAQFTAGLQEDLELVGAEAADEIVKTTLQGKGEGGELFAAYSASYQALLDSVGGKPGGVVDLRGIFYPPGKEPNRPNRRKGSKAFAREAERSRRALRRGVGRRAFVRIAIGGRTFFAQTRPTRPRRGITDPLSEMSRDLIHVIATDTSFTLEYRPREKSYMVEHQKTRPWFTLNKPTVTAIVRAFLIALFKARVNAFNA